MDTNLNKEPPEIPLGLGMALAMDISAMSNFASLTSEKKKNIIQYVQASTTGDDAKMRINKTVSDLKNQVDGSIM